MIEKSIKIELTNAELLELQPFISPLQTAKDKLLALHEEAELARAEHKIASIHFWKASEKMHKDIHDGTWRYIDDKQTFVKISDETIDPTILNKLLGGG